MNFGMEVKQIQQQMQQMQMQLQMQMQMQQQIQQQMQMFNSQLVAFVSHFDKSL